MVYKNNDAELSSGFIMDNGQTNYKCYLKYSYNFHMQIRIKIVKLLFCILKLTFYSLNLFYGYHFTYDPT